MLTKSHQRSQAIADFVNDVLVEAAQDYCYYHHNIDQIEATKIAKQQHALVRGAISDVYLVEAEEHPEKVNEEKFQLILQNYEHHAYKVAMDAIDTRFRQQN